MLRACVLMQHLSQPYDNPRKCDTHSMRSCCETWLPNHVRLSASDVRVYGKAMLGRKRGRQSGGEKFEGQGATQRKHWIYTMRQRTIGRYMGLRRKGKEGGEEARRLNDGCAYASIQTHI